jgi:iron complex outermembrane receptor protein
MYRKHISSFLTAGLSVLVFSPTGHAQSPKEPVATGTDPAGGDYAIEEIVVTARRTQENIQEVPLSITALSSDDLSRESISTAQDLMGKVGSMTIGANGAMRNSEAANIRGQGATFGANPGVAMYWAEVPLPLDSFSNNQGGPGMFFDLENMQVLKGPQGTLFGRNTTGGALILEPAKPKDAFSARIQGEAGNYNDRGYEFVVNTPIYSDRLLLRVGGQKMERDGYTKDVVTGKDYDNRDYWTGRLGLTLRVGEDIENTLMSYRTVRDENGTGNVIDDLDPAGVSAFMNGYNRALFPYDPNLPANGQAPCNFFNSNTGSTNCGLDIVAAQRQRDNRHVALSGDPFDKLETGAFIDILSWKISDSLTLRNIASRAYYERKFAWDQDGSSAALNDLKAMDTFSSNTVTTTEELQAQGSLPDQGLSYVVGAYYEKRRPKEMQETTTVALFFPVTQRIATTSHSRALYAQGSYDLGVLSSSMQGWTLTAGARRTLDEVDGPTFFDAIVFQLNEDASYRQYATTWLASASYQFDNAMIYAKVARGYKAGGTTGLAANPANYYYDPEYVNNYELGAKSDFELGTMPVRLNGAIFQSDYTDMQRITAESYTDPVSNTGAFGATVFNAGKAVIRGFEMDFVMLVTDRLRFMGNYSYTDGEFREFEVPRSSLRPQSDCNGDGLSGGAIGDYSCMPFTDIPEQQYSLTLAYELPLDVSIGTVETSLTYSWLDERYTAPITVPESEPGAWLEDFGIVNASISWRDVFETRLDLQLFGTNLTDEEYRVSNSNAWNELAFRNTIWSEPRMYGLRATYRWGDE